MTTPENQSVNVEHLPEGSPLLAMPGFELLPMGRQQVFLGIPARHLEQAKPLIAAEIEAVQKAKAHGQDGLADQAEGKAQKARARTKEQEADEAITTFKRAENGDAKAMADLQDYQKELLGIEPEEEDMFTTILETESTNLLAQNQTLDTPLSEEEREDAQKILDLFKAFRGDLPTVDDAISPKLQLAFFDELTEGQGDLSERLNFAKKALELLTDNGKNDLFIGLKNARILQDGQLVKQALKSLSKQTAQALKTEGLEKAA